MIFYSTTLKNRIVPRGILFIMLLAFNPALTLAGGDRFSTTDGNWEDINLWSDTDHVPPGNKTLGCGADKDIYIEHVITSTCDDLHISGGGTLTIKSGGNLIVKGDFTVSGGSTVTIEPGGRLKVEGDLEVSGGSDLFNDGYSHVIGYVTTSGGSSAGCGTGTSTMQGTATGSDICYVIGLPIELISFNLEEDKGSVIVSWVTASETNNDYFEVQHSTDGLEWKGIDRLMGAGTSVSPNTYSAYHSTPENGINYYRIKQVDFDEATCYSLVRVVEVVGGEHGVLAIEGSSPNPFNSFLKVEYKSTINTKAIIELLDMNGNTVYSQMKLLPRDNSCFSINGLGGLSAGEYLLRVRARNVNVTEIVLKQ